MMALRSLPPEGVATAWLLSLGALAACGSSSPTAQGPGDTATLYRDVSATHLPVAVVSGLSMDARPADVDGDGDLDIIVAHEFRPNILLINDGSGRFTDGSDRLPRTTHDSEDVAVADFDRDGDLDIVIVSEDDQVNELYLNDGSGRFSDESARLPTRGTSNAVIVADLDGDGAADILIGNNGQNVVLMNDGSGHFADETSQRLPAIADVTQDLELGDVDGDGDADLVVGNEDRNRLLFNDGSGRFVDDSNARIPLRSTPEETREADFGDVDGDGAPDILFANVRAFVAGADHRNRLLINDGRGAFVDETGRRLPDDDDDSFDGDLIDIDGDDDLDVVTANTALGGAAQPYRVYLNDGTGHFTESTEEVFPDGTVGAGFDIEAADFDGDGRNDLYLASRGGADRLLLRLAP